MKHHVLDENTQDDQYPYLLQWNISIVRVGAGFGRSGIQDEEIIRELHRYRNITFHTQDAGFYHPRWRHKSYCLVYYAVERDELAKYIRRFLRYPLFNTLLMENLLAAEHKTGFELRGTTLSGLTIAPEGGQPHESNFFFS